MSTVFYSPKGGSCTTVTAAAQAVISASSKGDTTPTVIVDLGGDMPAVLGVAEPDTPGINE